MTDGAPSTAGETSQGGRPALAPAPAASDGTCRLLASQNMLRLATMEGAAQRLSRRGFTVWLTGLSGAGKSTIAEALAAKLAEHREFGAKLLDGDHVRRTFSSDLGFSRADRETNIRRLGMIAKALAENGDVVIVAAISPYRSAVHEVRFGHGAPFIEVFVDCCIDELIRRDTKGLYQKASRGELTNLSGVSDPYEPPPTPEVHVKTDSESVEESVAKVWEYLRERGLVPN